MCIYISEYKVKDVMLSWFSMIWKRKTVERIIRWYEEWLG